MHEPSVTDSFLVKRMTLSSLVLLLSLTIMLDERGFDLGQLLAPFLVSV